MKCEILSSFLILACLATPAAATRQTRVVASFGGECEGKPFRPSPTLASMIQRLKQDKRNPCDSKFCDGVFAYDLNGDARQEYFVRLACGATGNCTWGIFSDRPGRLRGTFTAWFFYIHRRTASWNALTGYIREGGVDGVIVRLRSRNGTYVQTSERADHGYSGHYQPFLNRMGIPKCS
jgi:hypothetical protein